MSAFTTLQSPYHTRVAQNVVHRKQPWPGSQAEQKADFTIPSYNEVLSLLQPLQRVNASCGRTTLPGSLMDIATKQKNTEERNIQEGVMTVTTEEKLPAI